MPQRAEGHLKGAVCREGFSGFEPNSQIHRESFNMGPRKFTIPKGKACLRNIIFCRVQLLFGPGVYMADHMDVSCGWGMFS